MRAAQKKRAETGELSHHFKQNLHKRWHVNRSIVNDECSFCRESDS